jgi:hypothetical protein
MSFNLLQKISSLQVTQSTDILKEILEKSITKAIEN